MTNEFILMADTETTNSLDEPLVYDFGAQVVDTEGHVFERVSWIVKEVFTDASLMSSAFYAEKIPAYWNDIWAGKREVKSVWDVYHYLRDVAQRYPNIKFCAHNAAFDVRALRNTLRYLTKSFKRWMLPFGIEIFDTMRMAHDQICQGEDYVNFCESNGYLTAKGKPQEKAEVIYRFLTQDNDFIESHTGFEDVEIETAILWECYKRGGEFRKLCFNKREPQAPAIGLVAQVLS